jgi:hypothetical protein
MTLTAAQVKIQREGLDKVVRSNGLENILPLKSLTSYDVQRPASALLARAIVVANELGNSVIAGRIRSQENLQIRGAPDLQIWWGRASPEQRLRVLSDQSKLRDHIIENPAVKSKARDMVCPFRGSRVNLASSSAQTPKGEWEDSEEDEYSS